MLFSGLILFTMRGFAIEEPNLRELDSDYLDIDENLINPQRDIIYNSNEIKKNQKKYNGEQTEIKTSDLSGGISELRAIVGKSQIIRFDEPVKRISITKPDLVDMVFLSPREIIMNGKLSGETTVIVWAEEGDPVFFNLFVDNNNLNFIKEVKKIAPKEDIEINFANAGTDEGMKVVLSGVISSSIIKERIVNLAEAYGYTLVDLVEELVPQIRLEVKIVEMGETKNKSREYEFKEGIFDYIEYAGDLAGGDFSSLLPEGAASDDPWIIDEGLKNLVKGDQFGGKLSGNTFSGGSWNGWRVFPNCNLSLKLKVAEDEGLVKILAEPNVMVLNEESATFNAGNKVPVPDGVDEFGNIKYTYEDVGINLSITPDVLEETERIVLDISAEVSEIDEAASTPTTFGFLTRKGETMVEVANNHTTVITGLVKKNEGTTRTKFPFLSNLPVVGKLFDSVTASTEDTELMIFVTASIVKPDLVRGR